MYMLSRLHAPLLSCALLLPFAARGSDPAHLFASAVAAYDANNVTAAANTFATLAAGPGAADVAVLYNLGNAAYRNGNVGQAIRAYRAAQYLAPRDPDIRANLGFAAQTAGVALPAYGFATTRLMTLSQREWQWTCRIAYLTLFLLLAAALLFTPARRPLQPPIFLALCLLALALAGLWQHRQFHRLPEWVLISPSPAASAPLNVGRELATLPAGTIVREYARRSGWLEIQSGDLRAWIPLTNALPVLP